MKAHNPLNLELLRKKTYASFDGKEGSPSLSVCCCNLFAEQWESWQKLKDAYGVMKTVRTRAIPFDGFSILLYNNPGRLTSVTAAVGKKDVTDRPCFLCLHNLPGEQKGIHYRGTYMILYNPMPVFPYHLTIAHVRHQPQAIANNFEAFLSLMADLGEGWIVLYNGPKCGASAPDHLHFQALPAGRLPIEEELRERSKLQLFARVEDVLVYRTNGLGREMIVLEGENQVSLAQTFMKILASIKKTIPIDDEPMMNLVGFHEGNVWRVALFPRKKHRPDVFFREGDERILVSPGVVEMAGVLITPMERDFERLDGAVVEAIYREISLDSEILANIMRDVA